MPIQPKQQPPYYELINGARIYTAQIKQTGIATPIITVRQNTLDGIPIWTREAEGVYWATLTGAFPEGRTYIPLFEDGQTVMIPISKNTIADYYYSYHWYSENNLQLTVWTAAYAPAELSTAIGGLLSLPTVIIYP